MKTFELEEADLGRCVKEANAASVLVVKNGKPVALVSDVRALDAEQIELGTNARFWKLIQTRRRQKSIPSQEFKKRLDE